jgi:hypothetical protein
VNRSLLTEVNFTKERSLLLKAGFTRCAIADVFEFEGDRFPLKLILQTAIAEVFEIEGDRFSVALLHHDKLRLKNSGITFLTVPPIYG